MRVVEGQFGDGLQIECTGRKIYPNCFIIGISPDLEIHQGYDGIIELANEEPEDKFTPAERKELADYMISLWQEYAQIGPQETPYDIKFADWIRQKMEQK